LINYFSSFEIEKSIGIRIIMCGRLNVTDCPEVIDLCEQIGIKLYDKDLRTNRFIRATDKISIISGRHFKPTLLDAIWWLLLEPTDEGFKPSKFTSFNTRSDKLHVKGSAGFQSFRTHRCIIPAMGFGETIYRGGQDIYHDFVSPSGVAFGGLYKEWFNKLTGELTYSCSIITLPPHPSLIPYHDKACPLILKPEEFGPWLNPNTQINSLLYIVEKTRLPIDLIGVQIDRPSTYNALGQSFNISKDIA